MTAVRTKFKRGDVVFSEGSVGHNLYYIESGQVEVSRREKSGKRILNRLCAGQTFGEYALFGGRTSSRSATVTVLADSEMVVISKSSLENMLTGVPKFIMAIIRSVIDKMLALEDCCIRMEEETRNYNLQNFVGMLAQKDKKVIDHFPQHLKHYSSSQRREILAYMERITDNCRKQYALEK